MTDKHIKQGRIDPKVIKAYRGGMSTRECARKFGITQGMVARMLDVAGVERRSGVEASSNYLARRFARKFVESGHA